MSEEEDDNYDIEIDGFGLHPFTTVQGNRWGRILEESRIYQANLDWTSLAEELDMERDEFFMIIFAENSTDITLDQKEKIKNFVRKQSLEELQRVPEEAVKSKKNSTDFYTTGQRLKELFREQIKNGLVMIRVAIATDETFGLIHCQDTGRAWT